MSRFSRDGDYDDDDEAKGFKTKIFQKVQKVDKGPVRCWKPLGEQMGGTRVEQTTVEAKKDMMGGTMEERMVGGAMEEMTVERPIEE